jgi:8-oxo-dGTP pyrophosphatase MutT (NUDIX family)
MLPSVAVMVFDDEERLLLAQNATSGLWMTVGGAIDPDESPADAAVRECWEETGLFIEPTRLVGVFAGSEFRITYPNGDMVSYVITVLQARRIGGHARPDGVEASSLRWVSRAETGTLPMALLTREMVTRCFEQKGTPFFAQPTWRPRERD